MSANPEEPARGYEVFFVISLLPEMSISIFADPATSLCFASGANKELGLSSIGYWSMDSNGHRETETGELFDLGVRLHIEVDCWETHRPAISDLQNNFHFL